MEEVMNTYRTFSAEYMRESQEVVMARQSEEVRDVIKQRKIEGMAFTPVIS